MSVQSRVVLAALCVFNACLLILVGGMSLAFVDGAVRFVVAGGMWAGAISLFALARHLRKDVEWR